jgi:hypothetical protein
VGWRVLRRETSLVPAQDSNPGPFSMYLAAIPAPHKYSEGPQNKRLNQMKKNRIHIFQML